MKLWHFFIDNRVEVITLMAEHLWLVVVSTSIAVAIGLPIGILLTRHARFRGPVLGVANVMQTVPSLALFGFLIPLPFIGGIGARTAIVALVLYALLPIIRNTVTGILGVDANVRDAAVAMGMTDKQVLWQVEMPLAMSVILTGIRVAVVINVGVATIAAVVGAGGLGTYIFRGLRQYENTLTLAGAVPAALMALSADFLLGRLEKRFDFGAGRKNSKKNTRIRNLILAFGAIVIAFGAYTVWRTSASSGNNRDVNNTTRVIVGSKDFTESIILAEIVAQVLEARGVLVERNFELGGNVCHEALVAGKIDLYPEYTGTSYTAILKHSPITDTLEVYNQVRKEYLEKFNVDVSAPLGFSNDFAILVRGVEARKLNLKTISDAVPHARDWRAGFGQDFMARADGYSGFKNAYGFQFSYQPREMDLALTYRALASNKVDIIAGNSTDGLIAALDLVQLVDDKHYFPPYQAVILTRRETLDRVSQVKTVLDALSNAINTEEMRRLNYEVDGKKRLPKDVAREWLRSRGIG